jgi:hypothetical protein
MDVLRTVVVYAHGYALVEACFLGCAACGPWPDDELSQMRRVSQVGRATPPTTWCAWRCCSAAAVTWRSSSASAST